MPLVNFDQQSFLILLGYQLSEARHIGERNGRGSFPAVQFERVVFPEFVSKASPPQQRYTGGDCTIIEVDVRMVFHNLSSSLRFSYPLSSSFPGLAALDAGCFRGKVRVSSAFSLVLYPILSGQPHLCKIDAPARKIFSHVLIPQSFTPPHVLSSCSLTNSGQRPSSPMFIIGKTLALHGPYETHVLDIYSFGSLSNPSRVPHQAAHFCVGTK